MKRSLKPQTDDGQPASGLSVGRARGERSRKLAIQSQLQPDLTKRSDSQAPRKMVVEAPLPGTTALRPMDPYAPRKGKCCKVQA
jgi:hypothetical protein